MQRRTFIQSTAALGAISMMDPFSAFSQSTFPVVRVAEGKRNFKSKSVEKAIQEFSKNVKDKELVWLFENCFPNGLLAFFLLHDFCSQLA